MILYTFLEQRDLSGKTIIPFCTHGGSGFSRTIETIRKKQPGARVQETGFAATGRIWTQRRLGRSLAQKNRIQPLAPVLPHRTG